MMVRNCWFVSKSFKRTSKKSEKSIEKRKPQWSDLPEDVLVTIFAKIKNLLSVVSLVCRPWYLATSDPLLWTTLDMRLYTDTNFIHVNDIRSWMKNMELFKDLVRRSAGNATRIVFSINCVPSDEDIVYISSMSLKLKQLCLPTWSLLKREGVRKAFQNWSELEELALCVHPWPTPKTAYIGLDTLVVQLGIFCKKLRKLKLYSRVCRTQAYSIARCLPELETLDLRLSSVSMEAVLILLQSCKSLKHLDISHCCLINENHRQISINNYFSKEFNLNVMQQAISVLEKFDYCVGFKTGDVAACKLCFAATYRDSRFETRMLYWLYEGHGCEPTREEVPFRYGIPYYVYTHLIGDSRKFAHALKRFPEVSRVEREKRIQVLDQRLKDNPSISGVEREKKINALLLDQRLKDNPFGRALQELHRKKNGIFRMVRKYFNS